MTTPLRGANGIAFGPDGRLYVCEFLAGRISAVDLATGDLETVVAPGGPIQAPDDLAFDSRGAMYVTDLVPGRVWRRDPDGRCHLVTDRVRLPNGIACVDDRVFVNEMITEGRILDLSTGAVLADDLAMGNAMQLGPDGYLYYPHMRTGRVFRIAPDGGTPELVAADVHAPVAVRFDAGGVLLVLSRDAEGFVTRIDLHGTGDRSLITSGVTGLDNAAFDDENRMYVSSYATGGILELHPDGRTREVVPRGFAGPYGVTIDLAGGVHTADHYRIADGQGVTTELLTFAHGIAADGDQLHLTSQYGQVRSYDRGSRSARVRVSGLARPMGLAVRGDGALIVTESGAGRVVAVDADDVVTVLADGLAAPADVAFDAEGRCYVSDEAAGAIYRLSDDGDPVPILDGLDAPQGLAACGDDLFVVEAGRGRVHGVDLGTGQSAVVADNLPAAPDRPQPALTAHGLPGVPRPFCGLAAAADGSLYLTAGGETHLLRGPVPHVARLLCGWPRPPTGRCT